VASNTWAEYDVTAAVSGDGPIAFVLVAQSADGAIFHSREAANPPQLVILVGNEAPTPTPAPRTAPAPGADPVLLAAGDIADCDSDGDEATAKLLDGLSGTVAALGDTVYESGTPQQFADCYDPTWGRHKRRTRPAVGNHEYLTSGAAGYFGYFGAAAGDPAKGYYSYDLGSWHIVVLNSNCTPVGGCGAGSPQETWLRQDLDAHPTSCTLAYWHHPRFSFGKYTDDPHTQALWQALYEAGAEIVLSGHDHNYQRWAPQTPSGARDDARGIREFVVGTGGKNDYPLKTPPANAEKFNDDTFGILQLTLHPTSYDWQFLPVAGEGFTDSGGSTCH
jgi:acid phosphatase type 7